MNDMVLYFIIDVKNDDMTDYISFKLDLYDCCKTPPVFENLDKENGFFNIYIPDPNSGLVFKGKLKEMEKKYKNFLAK